MKPWESIANNLKKAGWSWGCVSAADCRGRTIWITEAHRGEGKRYIVRAEEKLTAFLELESCVRNHQGTLEGSEQDTDNFHKSGPFRVAQSHKK